MKNVHCKYACKQLTHTQPHTPVFSTELEPVLGQHKLERTRGTEQRQKDWEWERYLACTYIPHPK